MDSLSLVLISLVVLLVSLWLGTRKRNQRTLPGPAGLPFVGFLPFMTRKPYVKLTELSKKYGPIYRIRLGGTSVVIITDYKLTKEAFASDAFIGRPPDLPFELSETTKKTGAFVDLAWKDQRRFSLSMLKGLGFGKTKTEEHIKVQDLCKFRDVLIDLARGFFSAGSETVRISLDWILLICAAYPQVQKKVHSEIVEVVGENRFPNRSDHVNMPYTEAVIREQNRWRSVIPINLMRYTLEDTELNGYYIPKHSRVLSITWAVHHNKELWGPDADEFRPERFLSADGKQVLKPEYYIPFSIGKRQCPGEAFAKMEVFNYVVAILQRFEITLPAGKTADFDGQLGIGLQPKRQDILFKRR
ncbi:cytochrome P450 2U1-like [Uloborus diversus]|uniref:cytochrome P450 2U1-like n=1 Tax=Uloborus diversus TaxID=327109 RepID=UPI0024095A39|nr:cytochrome P450 2U1-like [Uloborus diversus]